MKKNLIGKPEGLYKDYLYTKVEPTVLQPYILDYVMFCVINDKKIVSLYDNIGSNDFTELSSGIKINSNEILNSPNFKETYGYDIKNIHQLNDFEIMNLLKSVKIKSLISSRLLLRLKECNSGGYLESDLAPHLNMRASKNQILSIVNDMQRGYNKQLSKQNKNDKKQENAIEPEM